MGLHWKLARFLSEYCQNHPIPEVCFLCVRSAFSGGGKSSFGKFETSSQPDGSMSLVITSLQKEVSKPSLHFRQGYSETEEGEGEQRHLAPLRAAFPQPDPKGKCCS